MVSRQRNLPQISINFTEDDVAQKEVKYLPADQSTIKTCTVVFTSTTSHNYIPGSGAFIPDSSSFIPIACLNCKYNPTAASLSHDVLKEFD